MCLRSEFLTKKEACASPFCLHDSNCVIFFYFNPRSV
nr:MAG TPA: hypothetical protein [Caudoviricetes sp.]